jgi:hypothetical protein
MLDGQPGIANCHEHVAHGGDGHFPQLTRDWIMAEAHAAGPDRSPTEPPLCVPRRSTLWQGFVSSS